MAPAALAQVLRPLSDLINAKNRPPELLVGLDVADDAAVYRISDDEALIFTVDFFTPVVDDPYDYGAVAAANSMSDVFAMGGRVTVALNVGAFPGDLDPAMISAILRGGAEKVMEAGGIVAGGHTIVDAEPKYGLAVIGTIHPDQLLTKGGAQPGDVLVLTKPLGTGTISTALKRGRALDDHVSEMLVWMKRLNHAAAAAARKTGGIRSATDITGFGLLGHAFQMAEASAARFVFEMQRMPLMSGAAGYAAEGVFPGGAGKNEDHFGPHVSFGPDVNQAQQGLMWDPQTSGGLLLAVPAERVERFRDASGGEDCWIVGEVVEGTGVEVRP